MADEDEELSHLRAPDAEDHDLTEEAQDFRSLDKLIAGHDVASLTLPKRGEKDFESHSTNRQLDQLEASRQAMHGVLSWQRSHTQKNHVLAVYEPESNMAVVDKVKSQHFQTIGSSKGGKEWLLPEEALFLIERGTLDCRWPVKHEEGNDAIYSIEEGAPMSLQAAYAAFIGFEGGVGGKLTLEMYNVYAGLKRSGYVVFRNGTWNNERGGILPAEPKAQGQEKPQPGVFSRFFSNIWRRLSQPTHTISPEQLAFGPLVKPGLYRSYNDIFRLLQLIPSHDRTSPPKFILPPSSDNPFRLHFDVYRTTAKFRKTARGPPDFRICVINARETTIPTGAQLNDLMAQVPEDKPKDGEPMYKKLKHGNKNVILAIVDCGIPSYIRLADVPFAEEKIYERSARGGRDDDRDRRAWDHGLVRLTNANFSPPLESVVNPRELFTARDTATSVSLPHDIHGCMFFILDGHTTTDPKNLNLRPLTLRAVHGESCRYNTPPSLPRIYKWALTEQAHGRQADEQQGE